MIVVYSENHTKHINTKYSATDCYDSWDILLPLGFKELKLPYLKSIQKTIDKV
jgi:hypothetical protein